MKFHLAISCWLLLFPFFAFAQSVIDTVHIPEVEVIAPLLPERIALKITRPDSMAVASGITANLSELLMQHSPVFIKSYGGGSQATASFRGTAPSHTQVIWNGMVLNSSSHGYADLSLLPLFFVDDVYLLHGGSSLVKGSGALGGSIHLDNLPGWKHGASLSGMVEFGSFGTEKYLGKFEAGNKKISSVTRLLYDASDNDFPYYNVGVFPYRQDSLKNGGYQRGAVLQEFYWRPAEDYTVALRTWLQEGKRDLPPLMSYEGNPRVEYQKDQQARVQLELKKYSENGQFTFSSGLNYTGNEYFRKTTQPDYVMDDAVNREKSWFNRFEFSERLNPEVTFSGNLEMNYHAMKVENRAKGNKLAQDRLESGLLLHLICQPSVRTGLYLLSRTEFYDRRFIPFIPSAGIEWKASERHPVWLKADITRNFHKPGLNDLYWVPGGNKELKPEKGITGEISLSTHMKRKPTFIKQEVTLFVSEIKDWISWQPASNGASYWEASNLKEVLSRGVEYDFSGSSSWRKWKFNVSGNYALTLTSNLQSVSSVDKSRGKQLIYIPKHIGNIHGSVAYNNWTILTDIGYTGKRYTQSSNESTWYESVLNPFWLASISMQKSVRFSKTELNARFKIDNLLDTGYQQILWRPMPGRHYSLTLAAKWGK